MISPFTSATDCGVAREAGVRGSSTSRLWKYQNCQSANESTPSGTRAVERDGVRFFGGGGVGTPGPTGTVGGFTGGSPPKGSGAETGGGGGGGAGSAGSRSIGGTAPPGPR